MQETTSISQTNSGIRPSVIPSHRILKAVAITLIALVTLPMPLTIMLRIQ